MHGSWSLEEQGLSEAVTARIEAHQWGSTRSVYETKWTICYKWCITNQVSLRAPPVKSVADFLMYLMKTGSYSPALLMVIVQPLLINWEVDPSTSARTKISLVSWIVSTETDPKAGRAYPPFEPIKESSLKLLTFKTVFLLALGSGKCKCEIHAWQNRNIRHQSDWSAMPPYPLPSFLSKN